VKIPEKLLMSPIGGLSETLVTIAPIIMSIIPNSFSATNNPIGKLSLILEPSRVILTVSGLILIYLIPSIKNIIRFNFTNSYRLIDAINVSKKHI
jgi:hypothetical protein